MQKIYANIENNIQDFANRVIKDDCLKVMPNIPDKSIDMILCDLPYGTTQNDKGVRKDQLTLLWKKQILLIDVILMQLY